jgi:hypothetical protein
LGFSPWARSWRATPRPLRLARVALSLYAARPVSHSGARRVFSRADCDAIAGDKLWTPITWNDNDDVGAIEGTPIKLRISMKQAQLFGVEFE